MKGEDEARGRGGELRCDCEYVAHGADDDELVAAVQAHARDVHGMKLPAELILTLAATNGATMQGPGPKRAEQGTIVSLQSRRLR
jgi:predicted small metal-binding protein